MSKKIKVLVLHAKDTTKDAYKVQKALIKKGFQSITLDEFRSAQKDISRGDFFNLAINSHDYVVCIVSDGLFANCSLRFPIGLAFGQGKVITAYKPNSKVIMPTWYSAALKVPDKSLDELTLALLEN